MFPLRDHNPSQRTPWVTWALLVANVVVFLAYLPLFQNQLELMRFFVTWGVVPAKVSAGDGLVGLVSSQFLHGGWLHLGFNLLFLWIFGDNMEEEWGHLGFFGFYLGCGVVAGLAQVAADPASRIPMVGASGAIAGVLGGYLLMFPRARVDVLFIIVFIFRIVPMPAWLLLGLWFGIQIVAGVMADTAAGGVAYWAHAGGFVAGMVLTLPLWLRRGGVGYWRRCGGQPPHPEAQYRLVRSSVPAAGRRRKGWPRRTTPPPIPPEAGPWGEGPRPPAREQVEAGSLFPKVPRRRR